MKPQYIILKYIQRHTNHLSQQSASQGNYS